MIRVTEGHAGILVNSSFGKLSSTICNSQWVLEVPTSRVRAFRAEQHKPVLLLLFAAIF